MSDKPKQKDKEKKKRDRDDGEDKEAKKAKHDHKDSEHKPKKEKDKDKVKDKEKKHKKDKDKEKDKGDKKAKKEKAPDAPAGEDGRETLRASPADSKQAAAGSSSSSEDEGNAKAKPLGSPPVGSPTAKEPPAKKLKAWQDDELEVESDEEARKEPTNLDNISSLAAISSGQAPVQAAPGGEELDPLDAFMFDLAKTEHDQLSKESSAEAAELAGAASGAPQAIGEGMGVMGASRVKTISLEEVEALMGVCDAPSEASSPPSGTEEHSAGSRPAEPAASQEADDRGDEDDKFYAVFMAEMRKRSAGVSGGEDYVPASSFQGARLGYVFKKGRLGLGYYRDLPPALPAGGAPLVSAPALPPKPFVSKEKETHRADEEQPREEDEDDDDEEEAAGTHNTEEGGQGTTTEAASETATKVVESKKEKRRKRKEARDAEEKAKTKAAKLKAREGFGKDGDELMESDPDRSEQSSEEELESYFDLVKRFTTKKSLPEVDHSTIDYKPFRKNLYVQVKEITNMKDHEVDDMRRTNGDIKVRGKHCPHPIKSFLQCGLPEKILKLMERREIERPFPIQMQAIPALMCGRDMIGVAQTGSGKTLGYLLPMIRHILDQPRPVDGEGPIGMVVAPTRELALQIQREASIYFKAANLTSVCAYGGGPMGEQLSMLKRGADLLVGTPGRLIDVLTTSNGKITNLRRVTFLVLDEADRMFDMGFEPQIGMFLQSTRPDKQVALLSATLPTHVEALARKVLKKPLEITVGERNTAATNVTQFVEVLDETQKFYRLLQLLGEWHEHGSIIIFVHQQKDVDEMFTELLKYGYPPLALHGGQDQQDRDFTLQDFKDNVSNILIATSVAARGIDVKQVVLVINFKVPDHLEDYIHRIGRTGRAGKAGFAYTFVQPDEADRAQDMVDALRQCNQEVPEKLKRLAEDHQVAINKGEAVKRKRWGGFGGKGFKYDNSEKSRQQKDRAKAKKDLLIGDKEERGEEEEEFKDSWMEEKPKNNEGKKSAAVAAQPSAPASTAAAAAQVAAKLQADHARASVGSTGAASAVPAPPVPATLLPPPEPPKPKFVKVVPRKTDRELEEQAQKMAEETLKALPDEIREKSLPALMAKLKEKLRKAEEDQLAKAAEAVMMPAPPPPPQAGAPEAGLMVAIPMVPGVLGSPVPIQPNMVSRSMDQLAATAAKPGAGTAHLAEAQAASLLGGNIMPAGMHMDELEINDYPQVARQRISHREPLQAIEELTGSKVQVKGQHFAPGSKMPEGAKKLYVEIIGPTTVAVTKAKHEVHKMMEALAIRTLNIPGVSRAVMGTPGRYDPMVGK